MTRPGPGADGELVRGASPSRDALLCRSAVVGLCQPDVTATRLRCRTPKEGWAVPRASVVIAVLLSLLGGAVASCGGTSARSSRTGPPEESPAGAALSSHSSTGSPELSPPTCHADRTRIAVALTGSTMSQPFADISVTNTGAASCVLRGYPQIEAWGHEGLQDTARSVRLDILIHHGIYERADQGPRRVIVQPQRAAFFSVGTGAGYQGGAHPIVISRLVVTLPGTHSPRTLSLNLIATRPVGRSIPVGITAVRPVQQ